MGTQYHQEYVLDGTERPSLEPSWSSSTCLLLKRCWEPKSYDRPSMSSCCRILQSEIMALRDGDDTGLSSTEEQEKQSMTVAAGAAAKSSTTTRSSSTTKPPVTTSSFSLSKNHGTTTTRRRISSSTKRSIDKDNVELVNAVESLARSNEGALAA